MQRDLHGQCRLRKSGRVRCWVHPVYLQYPGAKSLILPLVHQGFHLFFFCAVSVDSSLRHVDLPSITSLGSRPNKVGVENTPATRFAESTKSMMRQSTLPVLGDCLRPLPIYDITCFPTHNHQHTHHLGEEIPRARGPRNNHTIDVRNVRTLCQDGLST